MTFEAIIECPSCGTSFEGHWADDSIDIEQLDAPPVAEQECPGCGEVFGEEFPGWTEFGGAG